MEKNFGCVFFSFVDYPILQFSANRGTVGIPIANLFVHSNCHLIVVPFSLLSIVTSFLIVVCSFHKICHLWFFHQMLDTKVN